MSVKDFDTTVRSAFLALLRANSDITLGVTDKGEWTPSSGYPATYAVGNFWDVAADGAVGSARYVKGGCLARTANAWAATVPVRPWARADRDAYYPCVVVHVQPIAPDSSVNATGPLWLALVDVAVKTHVRLDPDGAVSRPLLGAVRASLIDASALSTINAAMSGVAALALEIDRADDGVADNVRTTGFSITLPLQQSA